MLTGQNVIDFVKRVLHALIVCSEQIAVPVDGQTHRITHRHAERCHNSRWINFDHSAPPAVLALGTALLRIIAAEPRVHIAFRIANQPGRPVVIIVVVAPPAGHNFPHVSPPIAVGVAQSQDFRFVTYNDGIYIGKNSKRSGQSLFEQRRTVGQAIVVSVFGNPDVALQ